MGNRGRLHEGRDTREVVRMQQGRAWITCTLTHRGWRAHQWEPNHYTPLFFLDEALAFAAGHRPCAVCRRSDYDAFRLAWAQSEGGSAPRAADLDATLHAERRTHPTDPVATIEMGWAGLPDGVFVETDDGAAVVAGDHLTLWDGVRYAYGRRLARPVAGTAMVLTPPTVVGVLRHGYAVQVAGSRP